MNTKTNTTKWVSEKETLPAGTLLSTPTWLYKSQLLSAGQLKQNALAARLAVLVPAGTPLPEPATRIKRYRQSNGQPVLVRSVEQEPSGLTFRELVLLFVESRRGSLKSSTLKSYEAHFNNYLIPYFGDKRVATLKTSDVQLFANSLRTTLGKSTRAAAVLHPRSIQRIVSTIQSLMHFGRRQGYTDKDPCTGVEFPRLPKPHKAFFSGPDEVKHIISCASARWKPALILASVSGLRRGELLGLRIEDISFKESKIFVRNSRCLDRDALPKSGQERQTPISKATAEMLREVIGTRKTGYLFQNRKGGAILLREASTRLEAILKKANAKRPGIGWHSFRRYAASRLQQAGCNPVYIQAWLGWADSDTADGYVDTTQQEFMAAMIEKAGSDLSQDLSQGGK